MSNPRLVSPICREAQLSSPSPAPTSSPILGKRNFAAASASIVDGQFASSVFSSAVPDEPAAKRKRYYYKYQQSATVERMAFDLAAQIHWEMTSEAKKQQERRGYYCEPSSCCLDLDIDIRYGPGVNKAVIHPRLHLGDYANGYFGEYTPSPSLSPPPSVEELGVPIGSVCGTNEHLQDLSHSEVSEDIYDATPEPDHHQSRLCNVEKPNEGSLPDYESENFPDAIQAREDCLLNYDSDEYYAQYAVESVASDSSVDNEIFYNKEFERVLLLQASDEYYDRFAASSVDSVEHYARYALSSVEPAAIASSFSDKSQDDVQHQAEAVLNYDSDEYYSRYAIQGVESMSAVSSVEPNLPHNNGIKPETSSHLSYNSDEHYSRYIINEINSVSATSSIEVNPSHHNNIQAKVNSHLNYDSDEYYGRYNIEDIEPATFPSPVDDNLFDGFAIGEGRGWEENLNYGGASDIVDDLETLLSPSVDEEDEDEDFVEISAL